MAMQGYEVKFSVYANSQSEADVVSAAIKGIITEYAQQGIAVTAEKLSDAFRRWGSNPFVKSRITNFLKN